MLTAMNIACLLCCEPGAVVLILKGLRLWLICSILSSFRRILLITTLPNACKGAGVADLACWLLGDSLAIGLRQSRTPHAPPDGGVPSEQSERSGLPWTLPGCLACCWESSLLQTAPHGHVEAQPKAVASNGPQAMRSDASCRPDHK